MVYEVPKKDGATDPEVAGNPGGFPLWEVFIRANRGLNHVHAGSVHAADAESAVQAARDVYTRRSEGVSLWIVRSTEIHASDPDGSDAWFGSEHPYRHPTFYELPDEVGHM